MAPTKPTRAKKRSPKRTKTRPSSRKRKAKPTPSAPESWRRWLLKEAAVLVCGGVVGLAATSAVLWMRANDDVSDYLAAPPRPDPAVVWSAPVEVVPGQRATLDDLASDLLGAGYERVDTLTAEDQFTLADTSIAVWTAPFEAPGIHVDGGKATLAVSDGVVTGPPVTLRPTALATLGDLADHRTPVALDALSPWVEPAVLAMEDRRFREHGGVDPVGIARALWSNLGDGDGVQGGSTITQQLAKNLFLTSERTLQRKVREAFFATALEHRLSKDAILELYLSEVYLGQVGGRPVYGVEQAARAWFGVSAGRLTLAQAATVAGVIASPNTWSPVRHPDRATGRRDLVLRQMAVAGAISPARAEQAAAEPLQVSGSGTGVSRRAPWAVDLAVDAAETALGGGSIEGWDIHTHLQPVLQRAAERAVAGGMAELGRDHPGAAGAQVALVAVRVDDGAVVALVGGRDYADSPFDRATRAWRQPGSTVKPLTLLAAFDRDPSLTPISRVIDEPITRPDRDGAWTPRNHDGAYVGEITLREAIEHSRNVPAVKLAEHVGLPELQRYYRAVGLSRATTWHSAALGAFEATPMELAGAYTVFPGGGTRAEPWLVRSAQARLGGAVRVWEPRHHQVASARAAALATAVLQGVITDGTAARAGQYGVAGPAGGKTGTTDDTRDAWFVGFTPELAVAVWVGNDMGAPLGLSGSRAALPTWSRFVVASGTLTGEFPVPDGMVTEAVCSETHQIARDACPLPYWELFAEGTVPGDRCDEHGGPPPVIGKLFDLFRRKDGVAVEGLGGDGGGR